MAKPPAVQFYSGDFLTGTTLMTNEEVGLYIRLLCLQAENGSVPDDPERMSAVYGPSVLKVWPAVRAKFVAGQEAGTMVNEKMSKVLADREAFRLKQSEKGKASAEARLTSGSTKKEPRFNHGSTTVEPLGGGGRDISQEGKERAKPAEGFDEFYLSYPNKKARGAAEAAWGKLKPEERALCKAAIEAQVRAHHFRGTDGNNYVPHPASWLNARRWMDEVTAAAPVLVNGKPRQMSKAEALVIINELRQKHGKDFQTHHIPADVYAAYREQRA